MKSLIATILLAMTLQGCAATMAASGQNGPDMRVVKRQQTREDIEQLLGISDDIIVTSDGEKVEMYMVEARTEPSSARAAGHATADFFTFGLWEFVGGPLEAYNGRRQRVYVRYDNDRVMSIMTHRNFDEPELSFQ